MAPKKRASAAALAGGRPPKLPRHHDKAPASSSNQKSGRHNPPSSLHSQPNSQSPPGSSSQQPPRSSWVEEYVDHAIDLTQADDGPASSMELYGIMNSKIVGVRYYSGMVSLGERVLCRREPGNPYDKYAVRVDNVMRIQIGHLPATVVCKLAPYIDRNEIVLEGVLAGHMGHFDCPVSLYLYGTSDPTRRLELEEKLKRDKILKATELKATRKEAEAQRGASIRLRCNASTAGLGTTEGRELEELLADSEVAQFRPDISSIDPFAMNEDALSKLPKATQPKDIQSELLPYQLQGLAWMIARENTQPPALGSKEVVELWKRDERGNFVNLLSNHVTKVPPSMVSGGLLADDMGLGKTLQVISLILASGFNEGPTLIVAPVGVMSNWEQQIQRHVKQDATPRVLRYHKPGTYSKDDFLKYDVVVTTYDRLRNDFTKQGAAFSVQWRRIVLDEAHVVRNFTTGRAQAAYGLQAKSRWMLTGTPIVNSPKDFLSALKFLKITGGIEETTLFMQLIDKPLSNSEASGKSDEYKVASGLFQSLIRDLCLRRSKYMKFVDLKLPAKTEYVHRIKFRKDEKVKYDVLLSETTKILGAYRPGPGNGARQNQIRFTSVLEKLLRLRQLCCHWTLCGGQAKDILAPLESETMVTFTSDNLKILQQALLAVTTDGEECPICMEAISTHNPVITACKHRFGKPCVSRAIGINGKCPMCRQPLTLDSIVDLQPADIDDRFDGDTRSSKTEALEKILRARLKDPKSKVVIFSQWTSFLAIIGKLLDEAGYKYCRVEGWMPVSKRDQSIEALNTDPDTRIMLASLAASGVGLNLVAADTVILVDSWWAPAIEDQAIDRVHRLGQTRETTVWKLIMDGSVEDRVLGVQARKRELVSRAFQDEARVQKETNRLGDILELLS
ncbi:SNF2 family N-terminal domain-containing protein [Durotheca rogersii]|uniref:SNF2 family N-terminal domain-containing protein n=1 Tax=Durotheca rogersii TaxID=419775 RepID=UPI00221FC18E|nr:SNF2 family N-terminal domain-containing protein [Durotheca rogersii]KAI5865100.1 SNF2 family N-terminal domain-containing protein [Durotheca rogersii]